MKLIALIVTTTNSTVIGTPRSEPSDSAPPPGKRQVEQLDALQHHDARGQDLAGELGQRVEPPAVVGRAEQDEHAAAEQHALRVAGLEDPLQRRQPARDQQPRADPGEHREAAEPRRRDGVDVAVAYLSERTASGPRGGVRRASGGR